VVRVSLLDWFVLLGTTLGIVGYGWWRTRGRQELSHYIKGDKRTSWVTIGLSVMATQASAITFLSTPGQGYADGLKFVQIYLGLPIAMVIIAAVFAPMFRRLNVFTAYEYLGRRFDRKTRLLGAGLFLVQRGLGAGLTIYAPSIIISSVLGWPLNLTIVVTSILVVVYTASGGSQAVNVTQKLQMLLIFCGLIVAFFVIAANLPHGVSLGDALSLAGHAGRMKALDYSTKLDSQHRYTIWSGIFGGVFLSLAYFGTDQSQVQRYLSGASLRDSRLGLMFNAILKVPMQFFILLLGTLVFAFYQFEQPPLFFNRAEWRAHAALPGGEALRALDEQFVPAHTASEKSVRDWLAARHAGDMAGEAAAQTEMAAADAQVRQLRDQANVTLKAMDPKVDTKDTDYVFLTFVLDHLPHGVVGLLVAVIFAGGLSSIASELISLGSTTTIDFYRTLFNATAMDAHYVIASKWFTVGWGAIALAIAFFFQFADNLIQAVNVIGSIFYGPVLGMFIVAFFLKQVRGTAIFWGALVAQALVIVIHWQWSASVSFLWYNPIGVGACVLVSLGIQAFQGKSADSPELPAAP
jgi:solute:Na+ symporter, SSS family